MKHTRNGVAPEPQAKVFPELAPFRDALKILEDGRPDFLSRAAKTSDASSDVRPLGGQNELRSDTLSFLNMGNYGSLLPKYMMERKSVFIDRLEWKLPHVDSMEFDQYDTPMCRWIILHENGDVYGGIRLLPTTAVCGTYSYMLRDGQLGYLRDFPTDVLFFEAPVSDTIMEASRLFISEHVPAARRSEVQTLLMRQMVLTAHEMKANHVIGIVPAVWSRWLRRLGLYAVPIGPKFTIGRTTSQAALFNIEDQLKWARTVGNPQEN